MRYIRFWGLLTLFLNLLINVIPIYGYGLITNLPDVFSVPDFIAQIIIGGVFFITWVEFLFKMLEEFIAYEFDVDIWEAKRMLLKDM